MKNKVLALYHELEFVDELYKDTLYFAIPADSGKFMDNIAETLGAESHLINNNDRLRILAADDENLEATLDNWSESYHPNKVLFEYIGRDEMEQHGLVDAYYIEVIGDYRMRNLPSQVLMLIKNQHNGIKVSGY